MLIEDESLRAGSMQWVQHLRDAGFVVDYPLTPAKLDRQFKRALESGAAFTVKLERATGGELVAGIKNLKTREEKSVGLREALSLFQRGG